MNDAVSDPMPDDVPDDVTAAELAFGLLDGDERATAEHRAASDPAFAALCDRWRGRAATLLDGAGEMPSAATWETIQRRLPANDVAPARGTIGWQVATAIAAAVALVFGATLLLRAPVAPPSPVLVPAPPAQPLLALLAAPDRHDVVAVSYDPRARRLSVLPAALEVGARDAELWVIPAGGKPSPLGVMAAHGPTRRAAPAVAVAMLVPGATLAVSLEPKGGSPTAQPTGPVILTGPITAS